MDARLVPMLALLYLISHIDRANIGNAKIEGMVEDLDMSGIQYNTILAICEFSILSYESARCELCELIQASLRPLYPLRSTEQHPPHEVQTPVYVSWNSRCRLGHCDDLHGTRSELRRAYGCSSLARYF